MTRHEFLQLVDQVLELPVGTLTPADSFQEHENWTSLSFLGLIAVVDEEVGITLSPAAILKCATIEQLMDLVADKLSDHRRAA
jgi:acyl carrier protein